jgi:hypothetical protein
MGVVDYYCLLFFNREVTFLALAGRRLLYAHVRHILTRSYLDGLI